MNAAVNAIVRDAMPTFRELVLGDLRVKKMGWNGSPKFQCMTSMGQKADVEHDLNVFPWPVASDAFDEVHAYQLIEFLGRQGDAMSFFAFFSEVWRVLKPDGRFYATVTSPKSAWLWGDPGHTRCVSLQSVTHLVQPQYDKQIGVTAMTDYRHIYKADFEPELLQDDDRELRIVLRAVKPSRCTR
jgi:hypothetical protein